MKAVLLLVLCAAALASLATGAPARWGSGVNLSGMEFGPSVLPGTANTNYVLPLTSEVRVHYFLTISLSTSFIYLFQAKMVVGRGLEAQKRHTLIGLRGNTGSYTLSVSPARNSFPAALS